MEFVLYQAKDRQKKKKVTKGIRVDADGDASLEDFGNPVSQAGENEQENVKSTSKKVFPKCQLSVWPFYSFLSNSFFSH